MIPHRNIVESIICIRADSNQTDGCRRASSPIISLELTWSTSVVSRSVGVFWRVDFVCFIPVFIVAAHLQSKSFHQNKRNCECEESFQWMIDGVSCCETLLQGWAVGFVEAGRGEKWLVGTEVLHEGSYRLRQATCVTYLKAWLTWN